MPNVFVQRSISIQTLVTRVVGLVCVCILGGVAFFAQPATTEAVNLGAWATSTLPKLADWGSITYGEGRFVATALGNTAFGVMYSNDGITWATTSAAGDNDNWNSVTHGNGRFVAVGQGLGIDRAMYSDDGITWATTSAAGNDDEWNSVTYGNGQFVAVGDNGDYVMTSPDGITWTAQVAPVGNYYDISYGNGRFVAVGDIGLGRGIIYSEDGISWTMASTDEFFFSDVTFGNGRFVATTDASNREIYYSDDGIYWTVANIPIDDDWADVVYANGLFVTHGRYYYGQIWYSPDGVTWSRDTSVTNGINYYNAFAYGNGRFVAVGEDDSVLLSTSNSWSLAQTGFQFRNDNGSEVAATSIGGQNSSLAYPANATVRLRTQIDSALATTTTPYYLQYKNIATENFWHTVGVDDPYPRIRSVWSGSGSANATTHSLNKTQCEAGDLNLVIFSHDGVQTSRTTSTGWKKLGEASNGISVTGAIYYKFADGVDALTITTVSSEEASYVSYCIAGAGTPSASAAEGNSTNSNPPLHTTDAVRSNLFMVTRSGDSTVVASAAPSSYSSLLTQTASTTGGASTNVAYQYLTATSTDPGAFTSATEQWVAWTIAVPPRQTPTVGTLEVAINKTPATSTNNAGYGSIAWTSAGRATSSDELRATLTVSSTTASNYLNVTEWGFAIPSNAIITGITAAIEKTQTGGSSGAVRDNSIRLVKGGTVVGNDYASTTLNWQTTEYISTHGSSSNLWGTTWTPAEINATDFGIAIAVAGSAVGANRVANVDHVSLNVYYTVPAPIGLAASTNIASGGASTTARMIAPTTHTTNDFKGGHITEDQAPTPIVMASSSSYTELEWSVMATGTAATGETYQFRTSIGHDAPLSSNAGNALLKIAATSTPGSVTLSGTVYSDIGSTTVAAGKDVVVAVGGTNPVLYATTTAANGTYNFSVATNSVSASDWSVLATAGTNEGWQSVTYGNGRFVGVKTVGKSISYSNDGLNWSLASAAGDNDSWNDVTYGNGRFVAVGSEYLSDNATMYSDDGIVWATSSVPGTEGAWSTVTYGNGRFVALGGPNATNRAMYSDDGIIWTAVTAAGNDDGWSDITYGNGRFVAVGDRYSGDNIMYSLDGLVWNVATDPGLFYGKIDGITYGNGRFVAVSDNDPVIYSVDGITWATTSAAGNNDSWNSVTYGNGRFVAVGSSGDRVMTSSDGITWATTTAAGDNDSWRAITCGNGRFVAVGSGGDYLMYSQAGLGVDTLYTLYGNSTTTSATTIVSGVSGASAIAGIPLYGSTVLSYNATTSATTSVTNLGNLSFFDSTDDSNILYNAPVAGTTTILANLITATGTTKAPSQLSLQGDFTQLGTFESNAGLIEFTSGHAVASGTFSGASALSGVLVNGLGGFDYWRTLNEEFSNYFAPEGMVSKGSRIIAVANSINSSSTVAYSDDGGFTWATTSAAGDNDGWTAVTSASNTRLVAVGNSGNDRVMYSDNNGLTWATTSAAGDNDSWRAITYGNGRFVAVGTGPDRVMYSSDGITWATTTAIDTGNNNWYSITYAEGVFVAVSEETDYYNMQPMYSTDGITWATSTIVFSVADEGLEYGGALAYGNGTFVAIVEYGDIGYYSEDGITWEKISSPLEGEIGCDIDSMVFHQNNFVLSDNNCAFVGSTAATSFATSTELRALTVSTYNTLNSNATTSLTESLTNFGHINNRGIFIATGTAITLDPKASATAIEEIGNVTIYGTNHQLLSLVNTNALTLAGGASLSTLGTTISVNDSFVQAGSFTMASSSRLTVFGDFTNSGTFVATSTAVASSSVTVYGRYTQSGTSTFDVNTTLFANDSLVNSGVLYAPAQTMISGNYLNQGTFSHATGTVSITSSANLIGAINIGNINSGTDVDNSMIVYGKYLFVAPGNIKNNFLPCGATVASSSGCEIQIYDISDPVNPTYITGRDADGSLTGTSSFKVYALEIYGKYLFVGKQGGSTACSQVAGSAGAAACELHVFDISNPVNPVFVAGRDASGSATGTTLPNMRALVAQGNYLYVGKDATAATACSQTSGSAGAAQCELMVFDITTPTSPVYIAGRDASGSSAGTSTKNIKTLEVSGNTLYVGKQDFIDGIACSQVAGSAGAAACELHVYNISIPTTPTYIAGIDGSGSATGIGKTLIRDFAVNGNNLYVAQTYGNVLTSTPCAPVAGSATGCSILVFDISSTTVPVFQTALTSNYAASSSNYSSGALDLEVSGGLLYVASPVTSGICVLEASLANPCGIKIYNITSSTSPVLIEGFSNLGNKINQYNSRYFGSLAISGDTMFALKELDSEYSALSDCPQPIGATYKREGCDLLVFNLGGDVSGTLSGASSFNNLSLRGNLAINNTASMNAFTIQDGTIVAAPTSTLSIAGNFENRGIFNPRAGTTTLSGAGKTITGPLTSWDTNTNSPDFGRTNVTGSYTYVDNGTTSALTINSGASLTAPAGGTLTVSHNFTNNGTYTNNGATTTFGGNLVGRATGTSALGNTIVNARSQGREWQAIATSSAAGNDDFWQGITYGNGRFVAVGHTGDDLIYSNDSLSWTAVSNQFLNNSAKIAYGNNMFVVGNYNFASNIAYSYDGINWATTTMPFIDEWSQISFAGGYFYAFGTSDGRTARSYNGINWEAVAGFNRYEYYMESIHQFGNRLVAVGYGARYSDDNGLTWNNSNLSDNAWFASVYANGKIIALNNDNNNNKIATTYDGINWASSSLLDASTQWESIVYGNGQYVAVADAGPQRVITSVDGTWWNEIATSSAAGNNDIWQSVVYNNGQFVAVGNGPDRIMTSLGITTLNNNASTTNLTINASSTLNASGTIVTIAGNYRNNGTLIASSSSFVFNGTGAQVATGTMSASSSFNNLVISNTSGNGTTTQSVQFGAPVTASGTMSMLASSSARFVASSTNTFNNVSWLGGTTSPVWLRSSVPGTTWNLDINGTQNVFLVNVRDSNATLTAGGVTNAGGYDSGNNINWNFGAFVPTWNSSDWVLYDTITIQQENIDADLTDFPVYVNMADLSPQFWNTVSSTTGDIRIVTDDLSLELPREIVFASTTSETGELHFKANFISSTTDTTFRIYYNGVAADYADTATYGAKNVWNNYVAVFHLNEIENNTVGGYIDSTGNYAGTGNSMASTAPSGKLAGKAQTFDGSSDYIKIADGVIAATRGDVSLSTWFKTTAAKQAGGRAMYAERAATGNDIFKMDYGDNTGNEEPFFTHRNDAASLVFVRPPGTTLFNNDTWHRVDHVINGSNVSLYINEALVQTGTLSAKDFTNSGIEARLGGDKGDATTDWSGSLDEFRIASTTLSADWISAEYLNQSTTTDFYTAAGFYTAIVSLGNHPLGQVSNTFSGSNETDEPLFAFTLAPNIDDATTTVTLGLSNTLGLDASNLSDWRLYRDSNGNRAIDAGDVQVGGAGTFSTTSVVFAAPFLASTSHSYIVTADLTGIEQGDRVTVSLSSQSVIATSTETSQLLPVLGAVSSTNHLRSKKAAGTGSVNFINIGAPGNGVQSGGGTTGGEELGGQPNFNPPTTTGAPHNEWTNGTSGYLSDGLYTTETTAGERQSYGTYGFNIPTNNEITGIEVKLEASASTPAGTIEVALSFDNGTSITTTRSTATLSTTDTIYTLGTPSDLWGRAWVPSEFTNGTFGVRIIGQPTGGNTVQVDAMQVRVYHQAGGGAAGAGNGEL